MPFSCHSFLLSDIFQHQMSTDDLELMMLLGSHTCSARAFCFGCRVSHVRSQKLSEIGAKVHHLYRKLESPSKKMMSDFAQEVAKYPKSSSKLQNSVQAYCLPPLAMQLVNSEGHGI